MNRRLILAAALAATSFATFANDVDHAPNGYVSYLLREAQSRSSEPAAARAPSENGAARSRAPEPKSRAQVVAETREAARLGLLNAGEVGLVFATPEQARQIELAGERARAIQSAAR